MIILTDDGQLNEKNKDLHQQKEIETGIRAKIDDES